MYSLDDSDTRATPPEEAAPGAASEGPKAGDIIIHEGRRALVCKNGALRDVETRKFLTGVPWDSTTGTAAVRKRWDMTARRSREALIRAANRDGPNAHTAPEAFGVVVEHLALRVLEGDSKLGDEVAATRYIGKVTQLTPDARQRVDENAAAEITLRLTPEAWEVAARLLAKKE